ncbi:MAG: hypothetical protein KKD17_03680 [Nanoarchaeota archaeon]|nr:hypothetical protein [Nanoarchaeota archaeon]
MVMNGNNGVNYEDRLRGLKVFNILQRMETSKRLRNLDERIGEDEKRVLRVALEMDGCDPARLGVYIQAFENVKAEGSDLKDNSDGSFLVQASRLSALIEHAFGRLESFVPKDPVESNAYKKMFARLYGNLFGLVTKEQLEAAVDLSERGELMLPQQVMVLNYFGPGVLTSITPYGPNVKPAHWPGRMFEIDAKIMHDRSGLEDFVSSKTMSVLDAEDITVSNDYRKHLGFMRNITTERGFLSIVLESVFRYDDFSARRIVGESIDRNRDCAKRISEAVEQLVRDKEQRIGSIQHPALAERAPKIYKLLVAASNASGDDRKESANVALDCIRNFTGGLPERALKTVVKNYDALAEHPAMLKAYMDNQRSN